MFEPCTRRKAALSALQSFDDPEIEPPDKDQITIDVRELKKSEEEADGR